MTPTSIPSPATIMRHAADQLAECVASGTTSYDDLCATALGEACTREEIAGLADQPNLIEEMVDLMREHADLMEQRRD